MFGPDYIGLPEVLIVSLAVPSAIFGRKMIHIIEGPIFLENPLYLAMIFYVTPYILIPVRIIKITGDNTMTPCPKLIT